MFGRPDGVDVDFGVGHWRCVFVFSKKLCVNYTLKSVVREGEKCLRHLARNSPLSIEDTFQLPTPPALAGG